MIRAAALTLAAALSAAPVLAKPPYPDFWVQATFQMNLARTLGSSCASLEVHHPGVERHRMAAFAAMSDRGHHVRRFSQLFAPITPERYARVQPVFLDKYALEPESDVALFCAAGEEERFARTAIGLMLRKAE